MDRTANYNYVEEQLTHFAVRIETRSRQNINDLNIHAESLYLHLLNKLMQWELTSLNISNANAPGVDLVDHKNKIIIQVSSDASKSKIQSSLDKIPSNYNSHKFKFLSISTQNCGSLRRNHYNVPSFLTFIPASDIYSIDTVLSHFLTCDSTTQREIVELIRHEFDDNIPRPGIETNLAKIIDILASKNWNANVATADTIPFDIERKIAHNLIDENRYIIEDYSIYSSRLDSIYNEFDMQGINRSLSVLQAIRRTYHNLKANLTSDKLLISIIEEVEKTIQRSSNFKSIPYEELSLCVNILVVDAFMRCKIFEKPKGSDSNVAP